MATSEEMQVTNYGRATFFYKEGILYRRWVPRKLQNRDLKTCEMNVVGPLPKSKSGNRFILTICDYATRYPEAVPLPSTEAERVAKELIKFFSHIGIPDIGVGICIRLEDSST